MVVEIPKFQYRAVSMNGQIVEGIIESYDYNGAVQIIRSKSLYPIKIKELKVNKDFRELELWGRVSAKDLSIFCKQFASLLKAGISISEALDILAEYTSNRRLKNRIKKIYTLIHTGKTLSEAFSLQSKCFPDILISTLHASEISGTLDESLERMAIYFQKEYNFTQELKKAMTYPAIVSITAVFVIIFMMQIVVPQFISIFQAYEIELPLPTRIVLGIYHFFVSYGVFLLLLPIVVYTIMVFMRNNDYYQTWLHMVVLKIPLIGGLLGKSLCAKFNRLLAMLIASSIPLTQSLDIASKAIGNIFIEQALRKVIDEVRKGKSLGYSLKNTDVFPVAISRMISIGEESGQLEEMMEKIADFYEIEIESSTERIITLLEPLMILLLGGIIAVIVLAIAMPVFYIFRIT